MLLAIDIGNTNIVFGVFKDGQFLQSWRFATSPSRTADEYGILLTAALAQYGWRTADIEDTIIASVTPVMLQTIERVCRNCFATPPMVVGPGIKTRLKIRFEPPGDLGGDRIANAIAARQLFGDTNIVVIDFGTATVLDVISAKGEYLGGALTPGIRLGAESLAGRTARIPRVELVPPASVIGRNTVNALQSGLINGHVQMFEGMLRRIMGELGPAKVIATGDMAEFFSRLSNSIDRLEPNLTLTGLRLIYEMNKLER